jgi:hypothetical protein
MVKTLAVSIVVATLRPVGKSNVENSFALRLSYAPNAYII